MRIRTISGIVAALIPWCLTGCRDRDASTVAGSGAAGPGQSDGGARAEADSGVWPDQFSEYRDSVGDVPEYRAIQAELARGWNTWDRRDVLRYVLLPEGLAVDLAIKRHAWLEGGCLGEALIGRRGVVESTEDGLVARLPSGAQPVHVVGTAEPDPYTRTLLPHRVVRLDRAAGISTGRPRTLDEIRAALDAAGQALRARADHYGDLADAYLAVTSGIAWNTVYEPRHERGSTRGCSATVRTRRRTRSTSPPCARRPPTATSPAWTTRRCTRTSRSTRRRTRSSCGMWG